MVNPYILLKYKFKNSSVGTIAELSKKLKDSYKVHDFIGKGVNSLILKGYYNNNVIAVKITKFDDARQFQRLINIQNYAYKYKM